MAMMLSQYPGYAEAMGAAVPMYSAPMQQVMSAPVVLPQDYATTVAAPPMSVFQPTAFAPQPPLPGYVLQPQGGLMIPAAAQTQLSSELSDDSTIALVALTFTPAPLAEDDKVKMANIIKAKAETDAQLTAIEVAQNNKILVEEEASFWKKEVASKADIYLSKIGCKSTYIYAPEIDENTGARTYGVEVQKSDGSRLKTDLTEKAMKDLNEFVGIVPAIRRKPDFPDVVFKASVSLADCQSEKLLRALALTDKCLAAQAKVDEAASKVQELTAGVDETLAPIEEREAQLNRCEVTLSSWTKFKELATTQPNYLEQAEQEVTKATSAKALAQSELDAAVAAYDAKLAEVATAKQAVAAAECELQGAVAKADRARKQVPAELIPVFEAAAAWLLAARQPPSDPAPQVAPIAPGVISVALQPPAFFDPALQSGFPLVPQHVMPYGAFQVPVLTVQ